MVENATVSPVKLQEEYEELTVSVENIGGINRCDISIAPNVTILEGRNATNRSSLLRAIADVLGGEQAPMKTDAENGEIVLSIGEQTYTREYYRQESGFITEGEQYTDERELANLFIRLLEDNPVRLAVERGDDLRDLLMEPVDTDEIERELRQLENRRATIDDEIKQIERQRKQLPSLEERRQELEERQVEIVEEIQAIEATIEEYEASEEEAEQAEELLDELDRQRQQLQSAERDINQQQSRLGDLHEERSELEAELDEITVPDAEIETLESQLEQQQQEKRSLDTTITELQQIIRFNENILEDNDTVLPGTVREKELTAELDPSSVEVECWTCGSAVERPAIENRIDELRGVVDDYRQDRMEFEGEIRDLEDRAKELRQTADEKSRLEHRLEQTTEEIEIREEKLEDAQQRQTTIQQEIEEIETRVEETKELRDSDLVDAYQKLSKLEYDRGQIEQEHSKVEEEINEIEDREVDLDVLKDERKEIADNIEELRTRIDDLESHAVDQFNDHMDTLLDVLDFENIARVWIDRVENEKRRGSESSFELNIVRETTDGTVYEDSIDTLSESEREVIGLVVALTGYLTHEVYATVPVMLLDSLEAIDAGRLDTLIEYFSDFVPFLIVALLPEDAAELSDEYERVTADELQA